MRRVFFAIFMALYALSLAWSLFHRDISGVIVPAVMAASLWLAFSLINRVLLQEDDTEPLTHPEKRTVLLTEFFSPVVVGAFYYYTWRKRFPAKARQANIFSFLMFGLQVAASVAFELIRGEP